MLPTITTPTSLLNFCKAPRQTRKRSATAIYLTTSQKVQIMKQCSDSALILYEFYLSKAAAPGYAFEDSKVAAALGWHISKVSRLRQQLTREGYFMRHTVAGLGKGVLTILDPELIREVKASRQSHSNGGSSSDEKILKIVLAQLKRNPEVTDETDELSLAADGP